MFWDCKVFGPRVRFILYSNQTRSSASHCRDAASWGRDEDGDVSRRHGGGRSAGQGLEREGATQPSAFCDPDVGNVGRTASWPEHPPVWTGLPALTMTVERIRVKVSETPDDLAYDRENDTEDPERERRLIQCYPITGGQA